MSKRKSSGKKISTLASRAPFESVVERRFEEKVSCTTLLPRRDQIPIHFHIPGRHDQFIDVGGIRLEISVSIWKRLSGAATDWERLGQNSLLVMPYNLFLFTMWESMDVDLNGVPYIRTAEFFPFIQYLKTLLHAPAEERMGGSLATALYFPDTLGQFNQFPNAESENDGGWARYEKFDDSKTVNLIGDLNIEPWRRGYNERGKPLPENVSLDVYLTPARPEKCLIVNRNPAGANHEYSILIEKCNLLVPRIVPKASLLKQVANCNYVQTSVLKFLHPAGGKLFAKRSLHRGDGVPNRIFVILFTERQYNGSYSLSRLEFKHHTVEQMLVEIDNQHYPTTNGYQIPRWDDTSCVEAFVNLRKSCGKNVDVALHEFQSGRTIFCFDLQQRREDEKDESDVIAKRRSGEVYLTFALRDPLAEPLIVLVFLERNRVLSIDKNRNFSDNFA